MESAVLLPLAVFVAVLLHVFFFFLWISEGTLGSFSLRKTPNTQEGTVQQNEPVAVSVPQRLQQQQQQECAAAAATAAAAAAAAAAASSRSSSSGLQQQQQQQQQQ
eukprot:s2458_g13.t1